MRRSRFSEEQIIGILKQGDAGIPVTELCRQHGVSEQTFYRWKKKYGGMEVGEMRRLQQLEDENWTSPGLVDTAEAPNESGGKTYGPEKILGRIQS
jgi:putative transposase